MSNIDDVILNRRTRGMPTNNFVEGKIRSITAEGILFTVPAWDNEMHVFGPAPWTRYRYRVEDTATGDHGLHTHEITDPPVGARCVVVFIGTGVSNPWVLGWWA